MTTLLSKNIQPSSELKVGWIFSIIFSLTLIYFTDQDPLSYLVFLALLVSMISIKIVNYQISSFVTLFIITSIIFYPFSVALNLFLPFPAIRPDLWVHTSSALIGYSIGMLALSVGVMFARMIFGNSTSLEKDEGVTPRVFNILLFSLIFLIVSLKISTGNYYHVSVGGVINVSNWSNLLAVLSWVAYCGFYLQLHRYFKIRMKVDGILLLAMSLIPILLYFPSGNREAAMEHLPIAFIFYLVLENNKRMKFIIISSFIALLLFTLIFMFAYRISSGLESSSSIIDQYSQVAEAEYNQENSAPIELITERISTYVALGRVIDHIPDQHPFEGLKAMDTWWQIFIPGFMRPNVNKLDFNEPALFAQEIGISPGWWSSSPIMLKGDLFRRFGWLGLSLGMFIVGVSLRMLDHSFKSKPIFFKIFFYTLMAKTIWRLYSGSLLTFVVGFSRDLLIAYLIASVLSFLLSNLRRPSRRLIAS